MQILLWCFTMLVIVLDGNYHASRLAPADSYDRSPVVESYSFLLHPILSCVVLKRSFLTT